VKFTIASVMAPSLKYVTVAFSTALFACGGSSPPSDIVAPSDPEETIHKFMAAVKANDLVAMEALWGTEAGPATKRMSHDEAEQRLTVMRVYLEHERYSVLPAQRQLMGDRGNQRLYRVQLERKNCKPVVPFTMVRNGSGWLVESVDLSEAGNPARTCPTNR
jgi:hypothetical protein